MKITVVTGIGIVSPIGIGKDAYWNNVLKSVSGIRRITRFDPTPYRSQIAGEIYEYNGSDIMCEDFTNLEFDRSTLFALDAVKLAVQDAGLDMKELREAGCYVGNAVGGAEYGEKSYVQINIELSKQRHPYLYLGNIPNGSLTYLTKHFGFQGPCHTISTGCTASTDSIGFAMRIIQSGITELMLAGGTEAPITPITLAAFDNIKALSTHNAEPQKASRPFDKNRDGFVVSEGSCFLVMETLERAMKRGVRIYATILGFASTSNAFHMTRPTPTGEENIRALRLTLEDAKIRPEQVDYINAHGSSTKLNDQNETEVIKQVFDKHAQKLKISSTKSMVGHMLGAAGAIEAATTCLGIYHSIVPPTINYETPDPECDLDYTPNVPVEQHIHYAVSNASGFGGLNSALVIGNLR